MKVKTLVSLLKEQPKNAKVTIHKACAEDNTPIDVFPIEDTDGKVKEVMIISSRRAKELFGW